MKNIAFIPVRGGSKSIPLKNIKKIAGKPLIYWTLKAAQLTDDIHEIIVSTDNSQIKEIVEDFSFSKVKIIGRSQKVSTDTASTESVILEFLDVYSDFDNFILIQATSPLIESEHLSDGLKTYIEGNFDSLLSVVRQKRFIWKKGNQSLTPVNYDFQKRPRRQEFEGFFVENGAFYITGKENILKSKNRLSGKIGYFEMPEETYFEIDEPSDWVIVEQLLKRKIQVPDKSKVKLFVTDVDGVLTDAGMYYSENGEELKKFNTRDGKGFEFLREKNIKTAIITSEKTNIVERRAKKMKIDYVFQGINNKLEVLKRICEKEKITFEQVAYIGDDLNDIDAVKNMGITACPFNAVKTIKDNSDYICALKGGEGCVREFIEYVIDLI